MPIKKSINEIIIWYGSIVCLIITYIRLISQDANVINDIYIGHLNGEIESDVIPSIARSINFL